MDVRYMSVKNVKSSVQQKIIKIKNKKNQIKEKKSCIKEIMRDKELHANTHAAVFLQFYVNVFS